MIISQLRPRDAVSGASGTRSRDTRKEVFPMAKDTITVVMAVYNVAATITETIRSVLNQTYRNFTLLIIDDCSTDGSDFILKNFA